MFELSAVEELRKDPGGWTRTQEQCECREIISAEGVKLGSGDGGHRTRRRPQVSGSTSLSYPTTPLLVYEGEDVPTDVGRSEGRRGDARAGRGGVEVD